MMRNVLNLFVVASFLGVGMLSSLPAEAHEKPRLIVLTDIGGDPDDTQSMVRLMVYSNELEIEGLIASSGGMIYQQPKKPIANSHLIREVVEAYGKVRDNLAQHADGYPTVEHLLMRVKSGNPRRGLPAIGDGQDTAGSRLIVSVVDRPDHRPVDITVWGGQTDLAQALWRVRADRGAAGLEKFIKRIRIHGTGDQDRIIDWMLKEFPGLFYILSKAPENLHKHNSVYRGMYMGGDESLTSRSWMEGNIRKNHGPLGALYPPKTHTKPNPHLAIKEGDTPAWLYFLPNGLSDSDCPTWGGWGGRFTKIEDRFYRDAHDTVGSVTNARCTVWRWRDAFQRDFQTRMDWCVKPRSKANHHPVAVCNDDTGKAILRLCAKSGGTVKLSAAGSSDPDGHNLTYRWWYYPEAGTCRKNVAVKGSDAREAEVMIPGNVSDSEIHVILEVTDDGSPQLTSYRRVIITVD